MSSLSKKTVLVWLGILVFLAACAAIFGYARHAKDDGQPFLGGQLFSEPPSEQTPSAAKKDLVDAPPPGTISYRNDTYRFRIYYPQGIAVEEERLAGGAAVILLKDSGKQIGFQIFVTPYGESEIMDARFRMDNPSRIMKDPTNITIDAAPATAFISKNDAMGLSREIWFLHSGYLFEITAPQVLDEWLLNILQTWTFL